MPIKTYSFFHRKIKAVICHSPFIQKELVRQGNIPFKISRQTLTLRRLVHFNDMTVNSASTAATFQAAELQRDQVASEWKGMTHSKKKLRSIANQFMTTIESNSSLSQMNRFC